MSKRAVGHAHLIDHPTMKTTFVVAVAKWFVMDDHANDRLSRSWSAGAGVDNLHNREYFLVRALPQRTYVVNPKSSY